MRFRPHHSISLVLLLGSLLGGCTRQTATFPGHSDPEVWNAMVTVAENPVYDDWFVLENEVMTARPEGRTVSKHETQTDSYREVTEINDRMYLT